MPRDGSGRSHNAPELGSETDHHIIHGTGNEPKSSHVARADKTAEMPHHEHGAGLQDLPGSAGHSQGLSKGPNAGQGKGPLNH